MSAVPEPVVLTYPLNMKIETVVPSEKYKKCNSKLISAGGPRYMQEIGTPKIGSHIKRPTITVN